MLNTTVTKLTADSKDSQDYGEKARVKRLKTKKQAITVLGYGGSESINQSLSSREVK